MAAINLTAEFELFPNGTQLGQIFTLGSFTFNDVSGTGTMFVDEQNKERGVRLLNDGVEIILPIPVKTLDLRLGCSGSASATVTAVDSTGNKVRTLTFSINSQFFNVRLAAPEIASVIVSGNNEGILTKISTAVSVC